MRIVIALGGNALLPRGAPLDLATQQASAREAAAALAPALAEHRVVLTHGNGPQVGMLALQAAAQGDAIPLDVLVAESEGMIGYVLESELERVTDLAVLTVLTRTLVDAGDPAFGRPTKPIGPRYPDTDATRRWAAERGWELASDGDELRRVVASPEPKAVRNHGLIRELSDRGVVVVCGGGGGIPIVEDATGTRGVEAVVDKDLTSALLAAAIEADLFVMLTDVDGVFDDWGGPSPRLIERATPDELRARQFPPGSMGPKVEAACRFVEATGNRAAIGSLVAAARVAAGTAGTSVVTDG